ncbi:hypothetical protein DUNSADRAFT_6091 [Dunaliella salina]|uniref:Encoded protein n=1 Tax=Dunaliella salina TaxID=3046 RepID=A0ABQ7H6Z8_DUNSA|nr:hypothetical protein DUNSADRAFT_6091 [Dunaliella salina]|eukprot:KAF5842621.1 hypothetical protein DUNSADRAFT_6091 [Dunaliella salina]
MHVSTGFRVNGSRAKKSNPNCSVDFSIDEDAEPGKAFVELHFADEDKRKVFMADRRAEEITRLMEEKGTELETRSVLKEVKFDPWKPENRLDSSKFVRARQQ